MFKEFVRDILDKLVHSKMLITAQSFDGFTDISQEVITLQGLNNAETLELMKSK